MVHLLLRPQYLQAAGLRAEPGSLLFPARSPKHRKTIPPAARAHAADMLKRRLKQASWTPGSLFASLLSSDRHHKFS